MRASPLKIASEKKQTSPPETGDLLSLQQAAERLGLCAVSKNPQNVVRQMIREGKLVGIPVSKWTMVTPESIEAYKRGGV